MTKDELVRAVWDKVVVTDESLTRCMSDVRLALGDADQRIIKTVPRRGYMFAAKVSKPVELDRRAAASRSPLDSGSTIHQSQWRR